MTGMIPHSVVDSRHRVYLREVDGERCLRFAILPANFPCQPFCRRDLQEMWMMEGTMEWRNCLFA